MTLLTTAITLIVLGAAIAAYFTHTSNTNPAGIANDLFALIGALAVSSGLLLFVVDLVWRVYV